MKTLILFLALVFAGAPAYSASVIFDLRNEQDQWIIAQSVWGPDAPIPFDDSEDDKRLKEMNMEGCNAKGEKYTRADPESFKGVKMGQLGKHPKWRENMLTYCTIDRTDLESAKFDCEAVGMEFVKFVDGTHSFLCTDELKGLKKNA